MRNNKHIRKQFTIALMLLFVSISSVFAQVNKTVGSRITDITSDKELKANAILDLESTTKGFFLPRMTTDQRDAIKKIAGKDNGLAIYNIDIDCVEYWSERTNKWMSVCGSLPPAKLDLVEGSCTGIKFVGLTHNGVNGNAWQQGKPMKPDANFMIIEVNVTSIGTYQISASTDNGYFFSAEGQFQAVGTYEVQMKGMGTPINGYDQTIPGQKGDKFKFNFNGKTSTPCNDLELKIALADLDFDLTSIGNAEETYNVNVQATKAKNNIITAKVFVNTIGTVTVTAKNTELGMEFNGTKKFTTTGAADVILEPVSGKDIPRVNDKNTYALTVGVNVKTTTLTSSMTVERTSIEANNDGASFGTVPYYEGLTLNNTHKIVLPVKVTSSGKATLFLKGAGGVEFKSDEIAFNMPVNAGDTQNVEFTAVGGTLPNASTLDLTLSHNAARFDIVNPKVLKLPVGKKPVAYTIDCSKIRPNKTAITYKQPIGQNYYIIVPVNVTVAGEYEIETVGTADGVLFSSNVNGVKQVFPKTGPFEVKLYATDATKAPINKGDYAVSIVTKDGSGNASCNNFKVIVGFADINVLFYTATNNSNDFGSPLGSFFNGNNPLKSGTKRFGPKGSIVETGEVKYEVFHYGARQYDKPNTGDSFDPANRKALADRINSGKYNLIILDGLNPAGSFDQDVYEAMKGYVDKGGAMIVSIFAFRNINNPPLTLKANYDLLDINLLYGINYYGPNKNKNYNKFYNDLNGGKDFALTGTDFNLMQPVSKNEVFMGTEYKWGSQNGQNYIFFYAQQSGGHFGIKTTGSDFDALVTTGSVDRASVLRHKTNKKLYLVVGVYDNNSPTIYGPALPNGEPLPAYTPAYQNNRGPFVGNLLVSLISTLANE